MRHGPRSKLSLSVVPALTLLATSCADDVSPAGDGSTGTTATTGDGIVVPGGDGPTGDDELASPAAALEPVTLDMCCEVGCTGTLLQSAKSDVKVAHDGAHIVTRDGDGQTVLWDAETLAPITRFVSHTLPLLRGGKVFYRRDAEVHVLDADDGAELGACPIATKWGVALDGGYHWTADDDGLSVREADCSVRWTFAGPLADGIIHALADAVHVFDTGIHSFAIFHLAAADGATSKTPFEGDFPRFFEDSARYWTQDNAVHHVFTPEGTELFTGPGWATYGWGTRIMIGLKVVDIAAPGVVLGSLSQWGFEMGPVIGEPPKNGKIRLLRLDTDPVKAEWIVPADCCGFADKWSLAVSGDSWAYGGTQGRSIDHFGRPITMGDIVGLAGAPTGRLVVGAGIGVAHTYDVADDCTATQQSRFARNAGRLWISGNGKVLVSQGRYTGWPLQNPPHDGTRFYSLPDGELLASSGMGLHASYVFDHDVSDDGTVWSRTWGTPPLLTNAHAGSFPFGEGYTGATSDVLPKISPNGEYIATSDGVNEHLDDWVGDESRIYLSNVEKKGSPMTTFPGIAHGFLDDAHILVSHYVDPKNKFAGSEIVDLDGDVVQPANLPEIRRFYRIGTGEILAQPGPFGPFGTYYGPWTIYDPWTGAELWTAPPGATVTPVGRDFVAIAIEGRVDLHRWR